MDAPEVRYAKSGDVNIAYSVVGEGPFDLVFVVGWIMSTLEYAWEGPPANFFRRLASFSRLILFDKRGTGLSDRFVGLSDMETRMDDVRAVMDAVGSKRAAIMGVSEGAAMTLLFAATHPERSAAIVLYGGATTYTRQDDLPFEPTREEYLREIDREERERTFFSDAWTKGWLELFAPGMADDEEILRWWRRFLRLSSSPEALIQLDRMNAEIDVRHVLPTIRVPTLIVHHADEKIFDVGHARYMAERIPGAEYIELPGDNHAWFAQPEPTATHVERFLTGIWERGEWDVVETDRVLATVLFTDIVGSTEKAAELGDRRWRDLVLEHHNLVRRQIARFQGRELDTAGDGFFASFDGPARAIRCACAIAESVKRLGIEIKAGLHAGECEVMEKKVSGIAVHIGARVAAMAQPSEVLVSSTLKDLVAGSGIVFEDRGEHELKGVPDRWRLYAVVVD